MHYKLFDFYLDSNTTFSELSEAKSVGEPVIKFKYFEHNNNPPKDYDWFRHIMFADSVYLSIARIGEKYILRFPNQVEFFVSINKRQIDCFPLVKIKQRVMSHYLLNQVLPRMLNQQGDIVLHASAVAIGQTGLVFLGEAGLGKSSLCASLCMQGFPFLTDDSLLLKRKGDQYWGYSSYPGLRLLPDMRQTLELAPEGINSYSRFRVKEKLKLEPNRLTFRSEPVQISHLYVLDETQDGEDLSIKISPLKPQWAFFEMRRASFDLDTSQRMHNQRTFEQFSDAANILGVFRLIYPRDVDRLPDVHTAILEHIKL